MAEQGKIYAASNAIMQEGAAIGKNKRNQQQGFSFRGVDDVMDVYSDLLAKHGVICVPEVLNAEREERTTKSGANMFHVVLTVRERFYATDGSYTDAVMIGEAMDTADKASNKAMSFAYKYAFFQVFCIKTKEMEDGDAVTPEPSVKKTAAPAARPAPQASAPKPAARPAQTPTRADADVVKREIERRRANEATAPTFREPKASAYPSADDEAELATLFGGNG